MQNPIAIEGADDPSQCVYLGRLEDGFAIHGLCQADDGTTMKSCWVEDPNGDGTLDHEDDYIYDSDGFANGDCHLDEGNGYTDADGNRIIVMTEDYPYVPVGTMSRTVGTTCGLYA